jgi:plastocyanin
MRIRIHRNWIRATLLACALIPMRAAEARPTGAVAGRVTLKTKGVFGGASPKSDRSGVVVYLEGVPGAPAAPAKSPAPAVRQRDKAFLPRVLAVTRGSAVEFPNEDKIYHNVFSLSQAGKFDLGLYKSGTSKSVVFDKPGVVDVYCNIHPDMVASIKVLDTTYYATTDREGRFSIPDVPVGTWTIVAWVPGSEARGTVTVAPGGTAQVTSLEVTEGSGAEHHLRKDGTPYGRYQ